MIFNIFKKKANNKTIESTEVVHEGDYDDISKISNYFYNETGITFDNHISILKNKVTLFCKQKDIHSFSSLLEIIKFDKYIKQEIIDYLTTNETFFYREVKQIYELVNLVKKSNHNMTKILCAPSATGEEPYSIAIALLEAGVPASFFNITGIDINSDAISKAKIAIYKEKNIRNLSSEIMTKYFTTDGKDYILDEKIKSLVSFKIVNIFDKSFNQIGQFDFVFSRNMLIYFDKETKLKAKNILESMRKSSQYPVFFGHADLY